MNDGPGLSVSESRIPILTMVDSVSSVLPYGPVYHHSTLDDLVPSGLRLDEVNAPGCVRKTINPG